MILLLACAPDYGLGRVEPTVDESFVPVPVEGDDGGAISAEEDRARGVRRETFVIGGGAPTPVADFLFVVDGSSSMHTVIDRVREAFAGLADGDAFPTEARVAVTSMIPADPDDLGRVHPAAAHRGRNRRDPGFLRLVRADTIAEFLRVAPKDQAARFAHAGCETAWFAPGETDAFGVPCLVAHTQISMDTVRAEAGLTALAQLLERHGDTPLFRSGAAANVVFVSDTQDPGLPEGTERLVEMLQLRPDFEQLAALVDEANTVASFRVHAIAPAVECGERWAHVGPVYQEAAEASGGHVLDVCTAEDYRAFVREIGHDGAVPDRAVVALGRIADDAIVEVDGERVGYTTSPDGRALVLDHPLGPSRATVTVEYRPVQRRQPTNQIGWPTPSDVSHTPPSRSSHAADSPWGSSGAGRATPLPARPPSTGKSHRKP
ncbi:MAG: hypothetical protein ACOZNI_01315 [Myxococcota bacterium]